MRIGPLSTTHTGTPGIRQALWRWLVHEIEGGHRPGCGARVRTSCHAGTDGRRGEGEVKWQIDYSRHNVCYRMIH